MVLGLGCLGLVGIGVVMLAVGAVVVETAGGTATVTPTPVVVSSTPVGPQSSTRPPTPTPTPPPTPTPAGPSRAHPQDVAYANAGYRPPAARINVPPPRPESSQEAVTMRTSSRVYGQVVPGPTSCPYDPTDMKSVDQTQQVMDATVVCLMSLWEPTLTRAGYELPRPPVYLVDKDFDTPCGRVQVAQLAGVYCSGNGVIYMRFPQTTGRRADGLLTYIVETVLAHEFGHHVSARVGTLTASWWLRYEAPTEEAANQEVRRAELQADCFAGLALASMARSYSLTPEDMAAIARDRGLRSNPTHGTSKNRSLWVRTGMEAGGQVGRCNTFAAADQDVA